MTNTFSETLKQMTNRYYGTEDLLQRVLGLPSDGQYDMIVLSPVWNPEDVIQSDRCSIECLSSRNTTASYLIQCDDKRIAWLRTGVGAGSVVDACLMLTHTTCDKLLFLGSCTALKPDLQVGDLVVPNKAVSGTGATRYLLDDMSGDPTFLVERRTPPKGILWLSKAAIKQGVNLRTRTVFSADTLLGALLHPTEIQASGADVLDLEATAFTRCMTLMERRGVALLTVVGNAEESTAAIRALPTDNAALNETLHRTIFNLILEML